ncbi:MAG: hypothetical protein Q9170_003849 [Blastenia crenularia]
MSTKADSADNVPVRERKARPSLLDLFMGQKQIDKLRAELQLRPNRVRAKPAKATAASTQPAGNPAAEAPKPDEPGKPAEGAKPGDDAAKAPFTPAEDIVLLTLKEQNKTWKEISDVLPGRDKDDLRIRFKEIGGAATGEGVEAAKEGGGDPAAGQSNVGQGNKGKQQGGGWKQGKRKQAEGSAGPKKDEPAVAVNAPPAANAGLATKSATINPNEAVVADKKDSQIKGILKRGSDGALKLSNVSVPEGAQTLNGSPIIYIDENDPLGIDELSLLYNMNCAFEEQRWVRMASKFFDQTGKRIEPEWLKEKLKNCM